MFTRSLRLGAAVFGALGAAFPAAALASSHREAPAISADPAADNTDLYAWVAPGAHDKLYVVANWIPLEEPSGGPNFNEFSDEVRYEIHITRGGPGLPSDIVYYITFTNSAFPRVDPADFDQPLGGGKEFFSQISGREQTYRVVKIANGRRSVLADGVVPAPNNIGPRTNAVTRDGAAYNDDFTANFIHPLANGEGRVFAGPRDDGFYVDLGGIFDLANVRAKGTAQDGVAGYNTHTIALEIPTNKVTSNGQAPDGNNGKIGVWAASSRRKMKVLRSNGRVSSYGPWVQVSRLGLPLVNEALIGLQDKDKWNARVPGDDVSLFGAYFLNPVVVRDAEAVGIYQALGVPGDTVTALKSNRFDIVAAISLLPVDQVAANLDRIGDVLRVDMSQDSQFPNGRAIPGGARPDQEQVDVTDVLLTVILSGGALPISDGVDYNDKPFAPTFPFLATPFEGYSQGHGKPTP